MGRSWSSGGTSGWTGRGTGSRRRRVAPVGTEAWAALDVERLISIIRPENVPSWSVARALGFRPWRGDVRAGMAHVLWSMERVVSP